MQKLRKLKQWTANANSTSVMKAFLFSFKKDIYIIYSIKKTMQIWTTNICTDRGHNANHVIAKYVDDRTATGQPGRSSMLENYLGIIINSYSMVLYRWWQRRIFNVFFSHTFMRITVESGCVEVIVVVSCYYHKKFYIYDMPEGMCLVYTFLWYSDVSLYLWKTFLSDPHSMMSSLDQDKFHINI